MLMSESSASSPLIAFTEGNIMVGVCSWGGGTVDELEMASLRWESPLTPRGRRRTRVTRCKRQYSGLWGDKLRLRQMNRGDFFTSRQNAFSVFPNKFYHHIAWFCTEPEEFLAVFSLSGVFHSYCSCIMIPLLFFPSKPSFCFFFFVAKRRQRVTSDHFVAPVNFLLLLNGAFHRNTLHFVAVRLRVLIRAQKREIP